MASPIVNIIDAPKRTIADTIFSFGACLTNTNTTMVITTHKDKKLIMTDGSNNFRYPL